MGFNSGFKTQFPISYSRVSVNTQYPTHRNLLHLTAIKMSEESEFKAGQMIQKRVMKGRGCKKDTH